MKKQMSFADKDEILVKRIVEFQKRQNLDSFAEAVRILCESGLNISKAMKKLK